ncbi:MAG TPA: hypothetical protein VEF04_15070 [Blastocatellia bacterium]|nr:hypothetical protein [Blastocatellia bacterium]
MSEAVCEKCGDGNVRRYQVFKLESVGVPLDEQHVFLCVKCARTERRELRASDQESSGLTRDEIIVELNRFFDESGVLEICRLCHEQGTGCCPQSCRSLTANGCGDKKTLWCAGFMCSALLNALAESDPEIGRALKWLKQNVGVTEFRLYEMKARVPAEFCEPERPLKLPQRYPFPNNLSDGQLLRSKLETLREEVLEMRRRFPGK